MLQLNKSNGDISIGDILITPSFRIADLEPLRQRYNVRFNLSNQEYISYSITNADDNSYAFSLLFYNENLQWINIGLGSKHGFEPYIITVQESMALEKELQSLGGEKTYPWGKIGISEDRKGGSLSIHISYMAI